MSLATTLVKVYNLNQSHQMKTMFAFCFYSKLFASIIVMLICLTPADAKKPAAALLTLQDTCSPISTLPCTALKVSLPFSLNFNAPVSNTIADASGQGTGFTTVNAYSGSRLPADGNSTMPQIPGYEPSKISLTGGRLQLIANKGIDFQANNNQLNVLGVQIGAAGKLRIEVKLIAPYYGAQSQQAGIWYGRNDKTYLKLSVTGNKVELRKEVNDVSSTAAGGANTDQRVTSVIAGLDTKTVSLRLVIDSVARTAEGFYSTDGVTYFSSGAMGYGQSSVQLPATELTTGTLYAGVFATYRNGASPVTYSFDDLNITATSVAAPVFDGCSLLSTLPCNSLNVSLPVQLSFNAGVNNTVLDKNGLGTGFTTINPYSGSRLAADGQPSLPQVPGYEVSKITVTGGRLQLVANKGIDYLANNNQLNVLGVQINAARKLQLELKVINPYNGTSSQQGGIWYGLNDQTYIKLGITGNKVELRKELNNVTGNGSEDQRVTGVIAGLNTKTVTLRLIIDSVAQTAEGFYSTDNITFKSTGATGYARPGVSTTGNGLTSGMLYAGLFATYRNGPSAVTYTFDDFKASSITTSQTPVLAFSKDTLRFTVLKGGQVLPQSVSILSSPAVASFTLQKTNAAWLTLPADPTTNINLGPANISSNLPPGSYQALITCNSPGYPPATLFIDLNVIEGILKKTVNINFQDATTVPPLDYVIDYGQSFADRTGANQGALLKYGWKKKADGTSLSLVGNGRTRTQPEDILLASFLHMQANNVTGAFTGVKVEGYWEMVVPNGTYDVTVSVGDGDISNPAEHHSINIEGVNAINAFVPIGKQGDIGRFKTNTIRVNVTDERLTIDAAGGTNTKINLLNIVPITIAPYLYWSAAAQNITIKKGTAETKTFTPVLGNSSNASLTYTLAATYTGSATPWLSFTATQSGTQPKPVINYSAAKNFAPGIYYATLKATASNYTSAIFNIQLNVVDSLKPYVISSNPPNGAKDVSITTVSIAANNLHVPPVAGFQGGVDNSTINGSTVKLLKMIDATTTEVAGTVQGTGGGDAISFSPKLSLEPNTKYKLTISSGVKSYAGAAFTPYETSFTTGAAVVDSSNFVYAQFVKSPVTGTQNIKYSSLTIGPDDKFYALRLDGIIERFDINHSTGALGNKLQIKTLSTKYGSRTAIGLAFDPAATAGNLILWVSHSTGGLTASPAFDGNISRLQGNVLQNEQLMITKLPRSTRDHLTNSLAFGPDGALYVCQGSNSSAGAYDNDWQRDESLLAGAILRVNLTKLNAGPLPLNAETSANQSVINSAPAVAATMSDGKYNPYGSDAPLTIYASGVRNAFDMVWHSNGQLYLPTNGSGGGGNSPASVAGTRQPDGQLYNGPVIPATTGVKVQVDWLFRVNPAMPVGYYGHPNPLRGEYVINRGFTDNPLYSPTILPDAEFRAGYNIGLNHSPNGVIEYKSNKFNGALKGRLLVCRFSGGGDIIVMEPGAMAKTTYSGNNDAIYNIVKVTTGSGNSGLTGMSGFTNPLDLVEDVANGNLYINEYNWNDNPNLTGQITLLKAQDGPVAAKAVLAVALSREPGNSTLVNNGDYWLTIMNKGDTTLSVKNIDLRGKGASDFAIDDIALPTAKQPLTLAKNSSLSFKIRSLEPIDGPAAADVTITSMQDTVKQVQLVNRPLLESITNNTAFGQAGKGNIGIKHTLTAYPNPNTGGPLYVSLKDFNKQEAVEISLYNRDGRKLSTQKAVTGSNGEFNTTLHIDAGASADFYIVRVVYIGGVKAVKIIVNR
jgi:hypothetical protein